MDNFNIFESKKRRKNQTASLKHISGFGQGLETNNNEFLEVDRPNLYVKLEKFQVFEHSGQYALYGPMVSKIKELHKDLTLPIRINSRTVKECPDCPYKTIYCQSYKFHQNARHRLLRKDELFHCYLCSYSTYSKSKLPVHMVSHQTEKSLECLYCGQMFKAKHSLSGHIKRMHKKITKYQYCNTCDFKTKTKQGLISHKERNHVPDSDRKEEFSCMLCSFTTNKKWCLKWHMGYRHTEKFTCPQCSFSTPLADTLKNHNCKSYECSTCGYKTHRITHFKFHITRHRKREELPLLVCPFCRFTTKSPSSFNSHKSDHRFNNNVQCPECELILKKKSLASHIKTKHLKEKVEWPTCPSCDYKTTNTGNLQRHIESKHTDRSAWEMLKCQKCDYETKSKGALYMHEKLSHSDTMEVFKCKKCDYSTFHKGSLRSHERIHESRETIACGKCSKMFLSASSLRAHVRRIHEEGKTYVCELCPKNFQRVCKTKADLRRHVLGHKSKNELETFKCYKCPYEAKVKAELARHIRIIHTDNPDKYHICTKCYYKTKHEENLEKHFKKMHKKSQ